ACLSPPCSSSQQPAAPPSPTAARSSAVRGCALWLWPSIPVSAPNKAMCTRITPIPLPADDCDRSHSMHAALSSLGAATASFDAAMDSLLATTARHHQRVIDLEHRMERFRENLRRMDEAASSKSNEGNLDERVCMMFCPASYEDALKGMEAGLAEIRGELVTNTHEVDKKETPVESSASAAAMSAANAAVQETLKHDVQMDNGQAVPSDAWLDHASMGLGVGKALEESDEQRKVPQLFDEKNHKGDIDYDRVLDMLVLNASNSNKVEGLDRLESLEGPGVSDGGGKGDDESVYSVTSQMSAISVASSRMTAGQRRRWHKQQQMMQGVKGRSKTTQNPMHPMLSTHPEASSQSATADRQQSSMGSHPYLCEVFHDSYGIGTEPTKGLVECSGFSGRCTREGGAEFYPPSSHIPDLLVFNTTRNSYGLPAGAPLPGASAST
ncbi:hypothetical protein ACHAWF_007253, partial [Thalassiosira exigua]